MVLPARVLLAKQFLRRSNQALAAVSRNASGHTEYGKSVDFHHEKSIKLPLCTMDDVPVPQFPYKDMYQKEQVIFNRIMAGGIAFFLFTCVFMYYNDTLDWDKHMMPKSYRERKIYPRSDLQ